jgi:hypothetical protein
MHRILRIVSVALVFGAAACTGAESITGPQRTPAEVRQEGIGYLGGGGRSSVSAPAGTFAAP